MGAPIGTRSVISPQRQLELLALSKVGGAVAALEGLCAKFCKITRNGVGDYEIEVNTQRPGAQPVLAVAMPHAPGVIHKDVANSDKLKITLKCFDVDGVTPADLDFDLIAIGSDAQTLLG